ncbi:MAG: CidA/LrgA family protein [Rhodobiaceae bacterium]|nr:CidA/LrgA family protein [Rhodobiaceae bacterium]MCC0052997.1 CidA/LrgA family protein [Rhodobiaceae bacterium]
MIEALLILLMFQLSGEAITYAAALPVPGPVLGLVFLAVALRVVKGLSEKVSGAAHGILSNLSLLFVPAGVGVIQHADLLAAQWIPIAGALVVSTALTMVVTAATFIFVRRLLVKPASGRNGPGT